MAGSANIIGKQNYVLGIGHPKTETPTEGAPAVLSANGNGLVAGSNIVILTPPVLPEGDGVQLLDGVLGVTATGLTPFTSASGSFKSSDVGKICAYWQGALGTNKGYGVIFSVSSPTSAVLQLAAANTGSLTGVCLIYGTDKGAETNSVLANAGKAYGYAVQGLGLLCTSVPIVVPDGVTLSGFGRLGGFDLPENMVHKRQSIALLAPSATYGALTLGDGTVGTSPRAEGVNIDAMLNSDFALYMRSGGAKMIGSMAIRNRDGGNNGATVRFENGCKSEDSVAVAHNIGHCMIADSKADVHIIGGGAFGAGANRHTVKFANATDCEAIGVHMWKSSAQGLSGSQVHIEAYSTGRCRTVTIQNCTFDTTNGPHVNLLAPDGCTLQGIGIVGNKGFQNDSVPAATYPFMRVTGGASSGFIRAMSVTGNVGDSSFATESLGTYTSFIEGVTPPALRAVSIVGNAINNCATGYSGFTPNSSANNSVVPYGSGVTTTF